MHPPAVHFEWLPAETRQQILALADRCAAFARCLASKDDWPPTAGPADPWNFPDAPNDRMY